MVEDTNDIGVKAVKINVDFGDLKSGIYFRIALGGATGHKAFARDIGVLVKPEELLKVVVALVRVYIANGNRGDRKKARLKHLLEKWTLAQYLEETEKLLGFKVTRHEAPEAQPLTSPPGLGRSTDWYPLLKHWAIVRCPSGTKTIIGIPVSQEHHSGFA